MGMFDDLICRYPLPVEGANELSFQTKSLGCFLELYEIRKDGTLWVWANGRNSWARLKKPKRLKNFTGEIQFYALKKEKYPPSGWIEFSAYFVRGKLNQVHLIVNEPIENLKP